MTAQVERALQGEIMLRLRAWPVIALPIPNSIFYPARTAAERSIIARVISQMKNSGMLLPGAPDLALFWAGGGGTIELKRPKTQSLIGARPAGKPTPAQITYAERAADLGCHHAYASSWEEVRDRLTEWGATA